jgi:hypothetical protein
MKNYEFKSFHVVISLIFFIFDVFLFNKKYKNNAIFMERVESVALTRFAIAK